MDAAATPQGAAARGVSSRSSRRRQGIVRIDGHRVGVVTELDGRQTRFAYDPSWTTRTDAIPVSLTLPLRVEPYDTDGLHPFFENLLPEGWLLQLSTAKLKIAPDDEFGLLLATCADCAGAVEVVAEDQAPPAGGQVDTPADTEQR
jgi:serine/threonine-protein kinase HipA